MAARTGLSSAEAARRLAADGPNRLPEGRRSPAALLLLREMVHFFALLLWAAASEAAVLLVFLGVPPLVSLLGGTFPPPAGWALAVLAVPVVIGVDALQKALRARTFAHTEKRGI